MEMNDLTVDAWIASIGLSKVACAMIQPKYEPYPPKVPTHIGTGYGIASPAFGAVNASFCIVSGIQVARGSGHKVAGIARLLTGAVQTLLGITHYPKIYQNIFTGTSIQNTALRHLSMVNIVLGAGTVMMSGWNLAEALKKHRHLKGVACRPFSMMLPDGNVASGMGLSWQF